MSVRITRRARRVLDLLARGSVLTAAAISEDTNINLPTLWPVLDRLADENMISVGADRRYGITPAGRTARAEDMAEVKRQRVANWPEARPRGPRPPYARHPYTDHRTPWPKGQGRPR